MDNSKYLLLKQRAYENKKKSLERKLKSIEVTKSFLNEIQYNNRIGSHVNCIRLNPANTLRHEMMKSRVCFELQRLCHKFLTETKFLNGQRTDIVDIDEGVIYEVIFTETKEQLKEKTKTYPACFAIIPIDSKLPFNSGDIIDS